MYQVFTSMKTQFAQISLTRLSQILPDTKPHLLADDIETLIHSFFDNDLPPEKLKASQLRLDGQSFEKKDFFQLIHKPLLRLLKRQQKKIQQLVQFHTRPSGQQQLNRIKLDKILKECFMKIQHSARQLYFFVDEMERNTGWECSCKRQACNERQSFEQFCIDVFGFFYRSSKLINQEILLAKERAVQLHPLFSHFGNPNSKPELTLGYKPSELLFQLEKNCELTKTKKKKRNKKNKEKQGMQAQQKLEEIDQDQQALNNLIESIDWLKQEKEPCFVTEEWLEKIARRKDSFKK